MSEDSISEVNLFEIKLDRLLSSSAEEDIKIFVYDLFLVFRTLKYIDQDYSNTENTLAERNINKFNQMIKDWNLKYRDILLEFATDGLQCYLKIYLKAQTVEQIMPLLEKMDRYNKVVKYRRDGRIWIEAYFEDSKSGGENTLTLREEKGLLRLIYSKEDMLDARSPEFRICTFHGLKDGFDKAINLQRYKEMFSFDSSDYPVGGSGEGWDRRFPTINFYRK